MSKTVRTFSFAALERRFTLASYWWGHTWCPAVVRDTDDRGGYSIRVLKSETRRGSNVTVSYDYFGLDANGNVTTAPRGYARDYKPGRFDPAALDEAVAKYAKPEPEVENR